MKAIGIFSGRAHVLIDTNEETRFVIPEEAFGVPVRESFPQARYRDLIATMDAVFADGTPRTVMLSCGRTVTVSRWRRGPECGVGTVSDLPELRSQQALLDREFHAVPAGLELAR